MTMEPILIRVQKFARVALQIEVAIGFPAELLIAAWALQTGCGRQEADWLEDRPLHQAALFHGRLLQEASIGIEGLDDKARFLDQFYAGLHEKAQESHLILAVDKARKERA